MLMFLAQQEAEISPVTGIIFVVAVIAVTFALMKSESKNSVKGIKKTYDGRIVEECNLSGNYRYCFVTSDELILQNNQNSFKVFKLDSIKYVYSNFDLASKGWVFSVSDENNKGLKGELVGGTKAARKLNYATVFNMPESDAEKLCDFIIKHAPHVERGARG